MLTIWSRGLQSGVHIFHGQANHAALFEEDDEEEDREAYMEGSFEGALATKWSHEKKVFVR